MAYWDSSISNTTLWTLSGDDTEIATRTGATSIANNVKGEVSHNSGKRFFEIDFGVSAGNHIYSDIGLCLSAFTTTNYPGQATNSWGWLNQRFYSEGASNSTSITLPTIDTTYGLLVDLDDGKAWLVIDGTIYGWSGSVGIECSVADVEAGTNPGWDDADLIGASVHPASCMYTSGQTATLKLTAAEQSSFVLPSGYEAWVVPPFDPSTIDDASRLKLILDSSVIDGTTDTDTLTTLNDPGSGSSSGFTYRTRVPASALSGKGNKLKVVFGKSTQDWSTSSVYIGQYKGSGFWFFDGNQKPVTVGGATTFTISVDGTESDEIDFDYDPTQDIIISVYHTGSYTAQNTAATGYTMYYRSGDYSSDSEPTLFSVLSTRTANISAIKVREVVGDFPLPVYLDGSDSFHAAVFDELAGVAGSAQSVDTYHSDNTHGLTANMEDDNLATYCQGFTYLAAEFATAFKLGVFALAAHNSTAYNALDGYKLQGSNDTTDGDDGTWYDLLTFDTGTLTAPSSYPGWIQDIPAIDSTTAYLFYRITGDGTTSMVVNEWTFTSIVDPLKKMSIEQGSTQLPVEIEHWEPGNGLTAVTAKTIVFDMADCWGSTLMGFRTIEFYLNGELVDVQQADCTGYSSSTYTGYAEEIPFDVDTSKTGAHGTTNCWLSFNVTTNVRLIIVFDTAIEFDQLVINNFHNAGTQTNIGIKKTKITITENTYTTTTYDAVVTNGTLIFSGVVPEHTASNVEDDKTIYEAIIAAATLHTKVPTYDADADGELILSFDSSQKDNTEYVGEMGDTGEELFTGNAANTNGGGGTYTYRMVIPASELAAGGDRFRIKFQYNTTSWSFSNAHVFIKASSGPSYYGEAGTEVAITVGGSASVTISAADTLSDPIDFEIDGTDGIVVTMVVTASFDYNNTAIPTNCEIWYLSGDTADVANPSTHNDGGSIWAMIESIENLTPSQQVWDINFVGVWHPQDPTGNVTDSYLDSTVNDNHGTPYNFDADGYVDGSSGKAVQFDGIDQYITVADSVELRLTSTYTMESRFYADDNTRGGIFDTYDTTGYIMLWRQVNDYLYSFGGGTWDNNSTLLNDLQWYSGSYTTDYFYIDGLQDGTKTGTPTTGTHSLDIGRDYGGNYFAGMLGELRLSNITRSANWMLLTHLSLTDALITWAAYGDSFVPDSAGYQKPTQPVPGFPSPYRATLVFHGFNTGVKNLLPKYPTMSR